MASHRRVGIQVLRKPWGCGNSTCTSAADRRSGTGSCWRSVVDKSDEHIALSTSASCILCPAHFCKGLGGKTLNNAEFHNQFCNENNQDEDNEFGTAAVRTPADNLGCKSGSCNSMYTGGSTTFSHSGPLYHHRRRQSSGHYVSPPQCPRAQTQLHPELPMTSRQHHRPVLMKALGMQQLAQRAPQLASLSPPC